MLNRRSLPILLTALIPWAMNCSSSDPIAQSPQDGSGVVSGVVHDSAAALPAGRTNPWPADSMDYDGTLSGSAKVEIYSDSGWVSLGDPVDVTFDIFCQEFGLVADHVTVAAGTYSKARITISHFVAHVDSGGVIAGATLMQPKDITLGGANTDVTIERDVTPFQVGPDNATTIDFDLNTDAWMNLAVATAGTIDAAAVRAATVVYVRQ
jgi:hypothetical protein